MGSWLYVDDERIRLVLSRRQSRKSLTPGILAWMRDSDDPWGSFSGHGGSFGGGGAGGSWESPSDAEELPPIGAEWIPIIVGDKDCPPTGIKRAWVFMSKWDDLATPPGVRTYGPHENGTHTEFFGLKYRPQWLTQPFAHHDWVQIDNALLCGEAAHQVFPVGTPPGCGPTNGTGICQLPSPYPPTSSGDIYAEFWAEKNPTHVDASWAYHQQCVGNLWQARSMTCEPPRRVYYPIFPGRRRWEDRKRIPNAATEKVREDDEALPVIPPPFVFGFVPVPPFRPPTPETGGFRPRQPPRGRVREPPKRRGAIRTIFRILDILSEASEVVDCFYGTLPKATRKRWEKGRPNRGLLDQAGQYGIDGADWKMEALWHNSPDIDLGKALDCVAANQIEDAIVGRIQANLPKGAGTAVGRNVSRAEYLRERERNDAMWARRRAENAARRRAAA